MGKTQKTTWNHQSVYDALVKRGERIKKSTLNRYVTLYPQPENCAILYAPDAKHYRAIPLHLHPGRPCWRPDRYKEFLPAIHSVRLEAKRTAQEEQAYLLCTVTDWCLFAEKLGLKA